jgi:hypothetical protein
MKGKEKGRNDERWGKAGVRGRSINEQQETNNWKTWCDAAFCQVVEPAAVPVCRRSERERPCHCDIRQCGRKH